VASWTLDWHQMQGLDKELSKKSEPRFETILRYEWFGEADIVMFQAHIEMRDKKVNSCHGGC